MNPLTPSDCDLRDFPRMMIDIPRLFGSEFDGVANDAEWRFGVTLWLKSFHQVPAASLPDDDAALARLCGLGRDVRSWRKARAVALRGWVKADDGLLYHEVVAEIALEAWLEKLSQRLSSGAGNAARWGGEFDRAPIEQEIGVAARMLEAINPKSKALSKQQPALALRKSRRETPSAVPAGQENGPDGTAHTPQKSSQETGKGREDDAVDARAIDDWPSGDAQSHCAALVALADTARLDPNRQAGLVTTVGRLVAWRRDGASWQHDVVPIVTTLTAKTRQQIATWKFFDAAIAQSIAENRRALEIPEVVHLHERASPTDRRQAAFVGRMQDIGAAMDAAVERPAGGGRVG